MTQLEVGRRYLMRNGKEVLILGQRESWTKGGEDYFLGKDVRYLDDKSRGKYKFRSYGSAFNHTRLHQTDIIKEINCHSSDIMLKQKDVKLVLN